RSRPISRPPCASSSSRGRPARRARSSWPDTMRPLLPDQYRDIVRRALAEHIGSGGVTTTATVGAGQRARGALLADADCVLAWADVAVEAFRQLEPTIQVVFRCTDGDRVTAGDSLGEVTGTARTLLIGERTALNFLQRLSGIATVAHRFVEAAGGRIIILDT